MGLTAGIGVHFGPLVEGLVGSERVRGYDVIGDTVNTGKRLCGAAAGGEVLFSQTVCDSGGGKIPACTVRQITMPGKSQPLTVYTLSPSALL